MTSSEVLTERLHANPWNPNRQNERTRAAERESISTFGFIDPITVRAHPSLDGHYQIIDGEHRWLAAQDLGLDMLPVTILDVPEGVAKKLTVALNELKGTPDQQLLDSLIADIWNAEGDDTLLGLPYSADELAQMLERAGEQILPPEVPDAGVHVGADDKWYTLTARCPLDFEQVWENVVQTIEATGLRLHDDPRVRAGQVVEVMAAEYLATPGREAAVQA